MAFSLAAFARGSAHANSGIPTLWLYKSADTAATVNSANYFDGVVDQVKVGDFILAYLDTGGTPQGYIFNVNANDGTHVDVTDGLAIGTTDSD